MVSTAQTRSPPMSFPLLAHKVGKKCLILEEMDSCQWGVAADSCSEEHRRGESTNITRVCYTPDCSRDLHRPASSLKMDLLLLISCLCC